MKSTWKTKDGKFIPFEKKVLEEVRWEFGSFLLTETRCPSTTQLVIEEVLGFDHHFDTDEISVKKKPYFNQ